MTHKKIGVLAAMALELGMAELLSKGESTRRLLDQPCLRVNAKSCQREEAWKARKIARMGTRRDMAVTDRVRRPKDM